MSDLKRWIVIVLIYGTIMVAAAVCASVANGQLMPPDKAATLRRFLPETDNERARAAFADPALLLYTDDEMPRLFQLAAELGGGETLSIHHASDNIAANYDPTAAALGINPHVGHANREFPWRKPAGLDRAKNVRAFRFLLLPLKVADRAVRWPVVWWMRHVAPNQSPTYHWTYPAGTIVGEVLTMDGPDGYGYTFEVRLRHRDADYWDVDVLRPFRTPAKLAARIKELRPQWEKNAQLAAAVRDLESDKPLAPFTLADTQPRRDVFRSLAGVDELPELGDDKLVGELLTGTRFTSVLNAPWRERGKLVSHAPTTQAAWHIVPASYDAGFVEAEHQSCTKCHETAGRNAQEFARNGTGPNLREWYGTISGSDGIFSFAPLRGGATVLAYGNYSAGIRGDLVQAGVVARYDASQHPKEIYTLLAEYDPAANAPQINNRIVRGN